MTVKTLRLGGKRWVILAEKDYQRLAARAAEGGWPSLPQADARGEFPAVEYARASLSRKIIKARRMAGLSQAELARRAGIRPETLNRIEKGRTTPDVASIAKIERALEATSSDAE
jgi:DNA-binding XRE family transcriptional regulator